MRDVEVGVEAQLAEPPADLRDRRQQLVAQQPERRLQRLGRAEELLLARLPLARDRRPRLLGERRRLLGRAAVGPLGVGEHEPPPRARHRHVQQPPHLGGVRRARQRRDGLLDQRVRDRLERLPPRAGHARAHQPEHVDVVELVPLGVVHRHHAHAARGLAVAGLLLAQPGVGDGRDRAGELARGGLRRAAHVGGGELGEARQVAQPLDDLGGGREQQLPAQPEPLDQPVHVQVRARGVQRGGRGPVELEEEDDPVARLGRDLRRLQGGGERRDHVELAPARDLGHPREVDRPQLDRRPRQRAHDRARVAGVDQQPQPGQQVAHLGALEERRRPAAGGTAPRAPRTPPRPPAPRPAPSAPARRRPRARRPRARSAARPPPPRPGPARARTCSARTRPRRPARPASATSVLSSRSSIGATTAPAAASSRAPERSDSSRRTIVASGHSARKSRMFLVAAPRKRWIAWSSSANALIPPCSATSSRSSRPWAKLASCSSSISTCP